MILSMGSELQGLNHRNVENTFFSLRFSIFAMERFFESSDCQESLYGLWDKL